MAAAFPKPTFKPIDLRNHFLGIGLLILFLSPFLGKLAIISAHIFLVGGIAVLCFSKERPLLHKPISASAICLCLFLVVGVVSIVANWDRLNNPAFNIKSLRHPAIVMAILFFAPIRELLLVQGPIWARRVLQGNIALMVLSVVLGLAVVAFHLKLPGLKPATLEGGRIAGLDGEIISFALNLQFAVLLSTTLLLVKMKEVSILGIPKWILVSAALIGLAGLYLTFSRGPLLAFVCGLFTLGSLVSRRFIYGTILLTLGLTAFALATNTRYFQFEESASSRLKLWQAASLTFLREPVFGIGYREFINQSASIKESLGFPAEIPENSQSIRYRSEHPHNNILDAFASTGFAGGLLFVGFLWFWLFETLKSRRYRIYFVPLIVSILVSGAFDSTFFDGESFASISLIYLASQLLIGSEQRVRDRDECLAPSPLFHQKGATNQ